MPKLEVVDNHSFAPSLLTDRPVLDAGCRGFVFSRHFVNLGHPVVMMDPDPSVTPPPEFMDRDPWCVFLPAALVADSYADDALYLRMTHDPEARHVTFAATEGDPRIRSETIESAMSLCGMRGEGARRSRQWDLVKLNIEGSEYDVLAAWPGPIARQIVVSFHEHTPQRRGEAAIAAIVEHLGKWYVPLRHEFDERFCAGRNAWDSVFALKGLA